MPANFGATDAASAIVYWIGLAESATGEPNTKDLSFGQQILMSSTMVREAVLASGAETLAAFIDASANPGARIKQMAWTARAEFYFTRMLAERGVSFESYTGADVVRAILEEALIRGRLESLLVRLSSAARAAVTSHIATAGDFETRRNGTDAP